MDKYDASICPNSSLWLAMDESKRLTLVQQFLMDNEANLPEDALILHAAVHVVVENKVAMGAELIPQKMAKLSRQGLDRHDLIHVIGASICEDIFDLMTRNKEAFSATPCRGKLH